MKMHVASRQAPLKYVLLIVFFFSASHIFAQVGGSAAPFLLFSPSAAQSGMAETGTAIPLEEDPFNFYFNPAQLGFISTHNIIMAGFNPFSTSKVMINTIVGYEGSSYNSYALQAGGKLKNLPGGLPLSIGVGFLRQNIDLGEFTETNDSGSVIGKIRTSQMANSFSLGFGLDYFVRISAGFTYKSLSSRLASISSTGASVAEGSGHAFDIGILAEVPVIDSLKISDRLNLGVSVSAGYAINNIGPEFVNGHEKAPIPRVSRLGYGLTAGLDYKYRNNYINLLRLAWSSEANESMVRNNLAGYSYVSPFSSQDMLGGIFLLDKAPDFARNKYGISISALETISGYYGRESEAVYVSPFFHTVVKNNEYKTYGYSVQAKGIFKYFASNMSGGWLDYVFSHLDLRLSHSKIEVKRYDTQGNEEPQSSGLWSNYWEMGLTIYGL